MSQELIPNVSEVLDGERGDLYKQDVELDGRPRSMPFNCIRALSYRKSGELILATSFRQVLVVSPDRQSIKVVIDQQNPFNPDKVVLNYFNDYYEEIGEVSQAPVRESNAIIARDESLVLFHLSDGLILTDYGKNEHCRLLEENPFVSSSSASISPNGRIIAIKKNTSSLRVNRDKNRTIQFIYLLDNEIHTIRCLDGMPLSYLNGSVFFSPNNKFIGIIGISYSRIFHAQSLACVALLTSGTMNNSQRLGQYSPRGKYIAFINSDFRGYDYPGERSDVEHIDIWCHDPLWDALDDFYRGRLPLEQALLIIFLRSMAASKTSLDSVAKQYGLSRDALVSYLKKVYNDIKNPGLKTYIYRHILRKKPTG